jgi:hypothetical protein
MLVEADAAIEHDARMTFDKDQRKVIKMTGQHRETSPVPRPERLIGFRF